MCLALVSAFLLTFPLRAEEGTERFSASDLLNGRQIDETTCAATSSAVWIASVDGGPACIRYYYAGPGGGEQRALVVIPPDNLVSLPDGSHVAPPNYGLRSPASLTQEAEAWSRRLRGPALLVARPGSLGSSGRETDEAGGERELRLISAALDVIRERHGLFRFHLAGGSSGAGLAAALALRRTDIACVSLVPTSDSIRRPEINAGGEGARADPVTALAAARARPGLMVRIVQGFDDAGSEAIDAAISCARASATAPQVVRRWLPSAPPASEPADQPQQAAVDPPVAVPPVAVVPAQVPVNPQLALASPDASALPPREKFSRQDILGGTVSSPIACASLGMAVWVDVTGKPECIRYYLSDVGGKGNRALVFMNGDFTYRGTDGLPTVEPDYANLGPDDLQHIADVRSRDYGGPMIYLARPGTFGSSGTELMVRHTPREVALVNAAISAIKQRHGFETFDLVGHSGGGLLLGALIASRSDIGCAASSSGVLATNDWISQRLQIPAPHDGLLYDPLDHVAEIRPGPRLRLFVLTDLLDLRVPPMTTELYIEALEARRIQVQHLRLSAGDEAHHDLALHAFRAAIACAHGLSDAAVASVVGETVIANRRMSEMGPLGDMPAEPPRREGRGHPDVRRPPVILPQRGDP